MYCTRCGVQVEGEAKFCAACGYAVAPTAVLLGVRYPRLSRPVYEKKIAGVCAGFARYFGMDVTLVRILFVLLAFCPFPAGLVLYIAAWILMPREPLALTQAVQPVNPHPAT